jgi:hypothetical protein
MAAAIRPQVSPGKAARCHKFTEKAEKRVYGKGFAFLTGLGL